MIALTAIKDWDVQQLDIKGAYLHGDLDEEIYMEQPSHFNDGTNKVCFLKHSLYGLKQSGRSWYFKFCDILTKYGFKQSNVEHCVYIRKQNNQIQIISAWINDLLLIGNSAEETVEMKAILAQEFEIRDLVSLDAPAVLAGKHTMWVKLSNSGDTLELLVPSHIRKIVGG